ncbi:hypothetical protein ARMA_0550 [Ardenticatena maritima]|uniref:GH16 domain-containing protein n=2 Tax=Ardenticatena maritima TaxID=872965 RepID=A0A0N0RFB5_9CHLR|nr:hypothetical protein ARMA_0550 [Ardenticatena maritima]
MMGKRQRFLAALGAYLVGGMVFGVLVGCAVGGAPEPSPTATTPPPTPTPERWVLEWEDDFSQDIRESNNWLFDKGASGWGNREWQYYTDRPENARVEDGVLILEARNEEYSAWSYTSARIKTQYMHAWTYGRVEARIKLPPGGKGIWPAFWMLGEDIATKGWPECGEIDIMENIGNPREVYGTVHGPGYSGAGGIDGRFVSDVSLAEDFHIYAIEWTPDDIRWYVDETQYHQVFREHVPGEWVFDHPFFILLNVAVGGEWPGYPDETTPFPQQMLVDYVRVYRDTTLTLPSP